jgi:hypothetical protein
MESKTSQMLFRSGYLTSRYAASCRPSANLSNLLRQCKTFLPLLSCFAPKPLDFGDFTRLTGTIRECKLFIAVLCGNADRTLLSFINNNLA